VGTDDVIRVAGYRPVQTKLPEELMDAVNDELTIQLTTGYGLTYGDVDRAVTAAIDWLRENPAELARLLGWEYFRSPTGRDALRVRLAASAGAPTSWDV
jgi:hypothetical protein